MKTSHLLATGVVWASLTVYFAVAAAGPVANETTKQGLMALWDEEDDDTEDPRCGPWAKVGECAANPGYMLAHCKAACGRHQPSISPNALKMAAEARAAVAAAVGQSSAFQTRLTELLADTFTKSCRDEVTPPFPSPFPTCNWHPASAFQPRARNRFA